MIKKYGLLILSIIVIPALLLAAGCGGGSIVAKAGDTVKVHYTGTLVNGTQFDTSVGGDPLEFTLGAGQVIAGFDKAVTGMKKGEKKTVTIPMDEAYGPRDESLVFEVSKDRLPPTITPEKGMQLQMTQSNGQPMAVTVINVSDTTVTLDANNPMAGLDLTFALELVEIEAK